MCGERGMFAKNNCTQQDKILQQTIWRYHSEDRSDYSETLVWMMAPLKGIHRSVTWTPYNCHLEERIDLECIMFRSFSFHIELQGV